MAELIVERESLLHNIHAIQSEMGQSRIIGVVKGNGYGLGLLEFAALLLEAGVKTLAVSRLEEAEQLRAAGIGCEILLLSPTSRPADAEKIVRLSLTAAIASLEDGLVLNTAAASADRSVKAHLLLDTGFGRYGFLPAETPKIGKLLESLTSVEITGIFTHLASSFARSKKATLAQYDLFKKVCDDLKAFGLKNTIRHIANSCGALRFPQLRLEAVRIGSAFLGRLPIKNKLGLRPVCHLEVPVDGVRFLPAGHTVGYGSLYKTKRPTRIAVVEAGYADGVGVEKCKDAFRTFDKLRYIYGDLKRFITKNGLSCTLNGKTVRAIGRIGMTNFVLDVSEVDCHAGDKAVFAANPILVNASVPRIYR